MVSESSASSAQAVAYQPSVPQPGASFVRRPGFFCPASGNRGPFPCKEAASRPPVGLREPWGPKTCNYLQRGGSFLAAFLCLPKSSPCQTRFDGIV